MKYIESKDRYQLILFPEKIDDLVSEDNPVRFIDAFVDSLDLRVLGFGKTVLNPKSSGRPCFSPNHLLKLYVYGYFKKTRSSRKLMELCNINIEVMWLLGMLTPDFRTIADFRKDNTSGIKNVFKAFVKLCAELGLYNKEEGVQDGSKFRAVNSKENNVTEKKLQKKIDLTEEKINKFLESMDELDKEENDSLLLTKEEISEAIKKLNEKKEDYNRILSEMKEEGVSQKSLTDPDSRLMKTANGGFDVCYNTQIIVDPVSHIIGGFALTNQGNDMGLLSSTTAEMKKNLGIDLFEVTADKGYIDKADMLECLLSGTIPHVIPKSDEASYEFVLDYEEASVTDELLGSTKPEDIKACLKSGVLPNAYQEKGIKISIIETKEEILNDVSSQKNFLLNEETGVVICPNGSELREVARLYTKGKKRFTSRSACSKCKNKCTAAKFKQVDLKDGQTVVPRKTFRTLKKVKIRLTPDKSKTRGRKTVVEHPFGTIKRGQDGTYLLLKGIPKASADMALLLMAYNIKRVISILGMQNLIERMGEISRGIFCFSFKFFQFREILLVFRNSEAKPQHNSVIPV